MKKSTMARPVVLSLETSKALRAWAKPLGLTPDQEDKFLNSEADTACYAQTTSYEIREAFNYFLKPEAVPPALMHGVDFDGQDLAGWFVAEKLNGWRATWWKGILWSKSGLDFDAPCHFTANFPDRALDGELVMAGGLPTTANRVASAVRSGQWSRLEFRPFDVVGMPFESAQKVLSEITTLRPITWSPAASTTAAEELREEIQERGGEGVMARRPGGHYTPGRSWNLLKLK